MATKAVEEFMLEKKKWVRQLAMKTLKLGNIGPEAMDACVKNKMGETSEAGERLNIGDEVCKEFTAKNKLVKYELKLKALKGEKQNKNT